MGGWISNCSEQFTASGNEGYFNLRLANNRTASRLVEKGYQTRFVISLGQSHCSILSDPLQAGTDLFDAIVWAWEDEDDDDSTDDCYRLFQSYTLYILLLFGFFSDR